MESEGFQFYFTQKGKRLCSKTQIGVKLFYTRAMIGSGFWPEDISPSDMTDLVEPKMPINITSLDTLDNGTAYVELTITNESIGKGFFAREIAIYALDPDEGEIAYVIGYAGDEASFIPAFSGVEIFEEAFGIYIPIGEAEEVIANVTKAERAKNISYDNSKSSLHARDAQDALDEVAIKVMPNTLICTLPIQSSNYLKNWKLYENIGGISVPLEDWGFTNATLKEVASRVEVDINTNTLTVFSTAVFGNRTWNVQNYEDGVYILSAPDKSLILTRR